MMSDLEALKGLSQIDNNHGSRSFERAVTDRLESWKQDVRPRRFVTIL